jgi:hypothetical protein
VTASTIPVTPNRNSGSPIDGGFPPAWFAEISIPLAIDVNQPAALGLEGEVLGADVGQ